MAKNTSKPGKLPKRFVQFKKDHPAIQAACEQLAVAIHEEGPLDRQTRELVQLGIAIGARQEGGVHSHTRRALEAGASPEAIRQVALLSILSAGFPNAMAAMSWVEDVLAQA